jgi:hypothetical protein
MPCCPSHFTQQTVTNPGRAMGLQPGFGLTYVDRAGALDAECTWVLDRCRATCQEFVG